MKIKTIDVNAKEWFDKVNGNSYFAGIITINYGMKSQKSIVMEFQYGYGDQYRYQAIKTLQEEGIIKDVQDNESYWRYYERKGIIARHSLQKNCLKRELIHIA